MARPATPDTATGRGPRRCAYLSRFHGTCLATNRQVLTVTPHDDGGARVTVDPPNDAGQGQGTYVARRDGRSDYLEPSQAGTRCETRPDGQTGGGKVER